jgi:WD40 repeat protein
MMRAKPYCTTERDIRRNGLVTRNLVFFDDAAYSGSQAAITLRRLMTEHWETLFIVTLFSTKEARKKIEAMLQNESSLETHIAFKQTSAIDIAGRRKWTIWTQPEYTRHIKRSVYFYEGQNIPGFGPILESELSAMQMPISADTATLKAQQARIQAAIIFKFQVPSGLTLFEHKLPDDVSFPLPQANAVSQKIYPNGETPPYKRKELFDFEATTTLLQCAADGQALKKTADVCAPFQSENLRLVSTEEINSCKGQDLGQGVFTDSNDGRLVMKTSTSDDAYNTCVAAGKGLAPAFHDAFLSPSNMMTLVTEKFDGTLRKYIIMIAGKRGTARSTANLWEALDTSLVAFLDKVKKARVCHQDINPTTVVVRKTPKGLEFRLTAWNGKTDSVEACKATQENQFFRLFYNIFDSRFDDVLSVACAGRLPFAYHWLVTETDLDGQPVEIYVPDAAPQPTVPPLVALPTQTHGGYGPFAGHTEAVNAVAFSPDGTILATGSSDKTTRLWDVATGALLKTYDVNYIVQSVAFSPDGSMLASGTSKKKGMDMRSPIVLWDIRKARQPNQGPARTTNGAELVGSVAFTKDGRRLVSSGEPAKIWDVASLKLIKTLSGDDEDDFAYDVAVNPDGTTVATSTNYDEIVFWDLLTGTAQKAIVPGGSVKSVTFNSDGSALAVGTTDDTSVWNVQTGQRIATLANVGSVSVAFSPDGTMLALGSLESSHNVFVWKFSAGSRIYKSYSGHTNAVTSVAFSPGGTKIASGSLDKTLRLWDV